MKSKIPLIVAVVGALLVGGATTGSTRASWTSQAPLQQHSVASGQMSYAATTPGAVAVARTVGATADTTFVVDDTSAGKNLTQRITASVAGTPTGVTATIGTSCPGASSVTVDTTPTSPDQTLCVRVTSSTTAVSGNVTINLNSAQRPTTGWTTSTISRSISVTVGNILTCPATSNTASGMPLSWTTPVSATSAQLQYLVGTTWTNVVGATTSPVSVMFDKSTRSYRVQFTGGTTTTSNTVSVVRDNNGNNNMTCGAP